MAFKKIGTSLVGSMISLYMKSTTTASSHRLASFIGIPPSMEKLVEANDENPGRKWKDVGPQMPEGGIEIQSEPLVTLLRHKNELSQAELAGLDSHITHHCFINVDGSYFMPVLTKLTDEEFARRTGEVYLEIFPVHAVCSESCSGHKLPQLAMKILKELGHPDDVTVLARRARDWFYRVDANGSGFISGQELRMAFSKINATPTEVDLILEFHKTNQPVNDQGVSQKEFLQTIVHVLENSIHSLSASDLVTIGHLFDKYDEVIMMLVVVVVAAVMMLRIVYMYIHRIC